jgi:hypothetical protein
MLVPSSPVHETYDKSGTGSGSFLSISTDEIGTPHKPQVAHLCYPKYCTGFFFAAGFLSSEASFQAGSELRLERKPADRRKFSRLGYGDGISYGW